MRISVLFILFFFSFLTTTRAQQKCEMPGDGVYYYYPRNGGDHLRYVNRGGIQTEYNLSTGDSAVFKITYSKDFYTLKYLSGYANKSNEQRDAFKKLNLPYEIIACGSDYLVFKGYLDKSAMIASEDRHIIIDTLWKSAQNRTQSKPRFADLTESASYLKKHFKDTSSYSIVYLYRPAKFFAMGNEYFVHANNTLLFWAQNNTRGAFKIYGREPVTFSARLWKVNSDITINPEPGKRYYIECAIHHRVSRVTPELKLVEKDGQLEYERTGQ